MRNSLYISNNFRTFTGWIGRSCKPSDKGLLTALPHLYICQHNLMKNNLNLSAMLRFEELPDVNSERWLSLEDLEGEIWKYIPNFPKYQISNYSRVKSFKLKTPRILRCNRPRGYYTVALKPLEGKPITKGVHRLMAETFIPNPNNYPQVNHRDENRIHNLLENLEWCTNKYNMNYGTRNARAGMAISNAMSIKIAQYDLDGHYIASYKGMADACRILGMPIQKPFLGYKTQYSQNLGYMWRQYEEGVDMTADIPPYLYIAGCRFGVEQYTKEGNYVATFITLKHACKYMGIKRVTLKGGCLGHINLVGGYKWKYADIEDLKQNLIFDKNGRCVDKRKLKT